MLEKVTILLTNVCNKLDQYGNNPYTQKHKQTQSLSLPILQMALFKMTAEKCSVQAERHYSCWFVMEMS